MVHVSGSSNNSSHEQKLLMLGELLILFHNIA